MADPVLTMDHKNWDSNQLVIKGDEPMLIIMKDQHSVLELNRVLTIAYFSDHAGSLDVEIDGSEYTFSQDTWEGILSVTDQWLEFYTASEYPEFFEEKTTAEIIPFPVQ